MNIIISPSTLGVKTAQYNTFHETWKFFKDHQCSPPKKIKVKVQLSSGIVPELPPELYHRILEYALYKSNCLDLALVSKSFNVSFI